MCVFVCVCLVIIRTWLLCNIHHSFECANPPNTHISCTCNITKTSPCFLCVCRLRHEEGNLAWAYVIIIIILYMLMMMMVYFRPLNIVHSALYSYIYNAQDYNTQTVKVNNLRIGTVSYIHILQYILFVHINIG